MNITTPHAKVTAKVKSPSEKEVILPISSNRKVLLNWPIAHPVRKDNIYILVAPLNIRNNPTQSSAVPKVGPAHESKRVQNSPLMSMVYPTRIRIRTFLLLL